MPSIGRSADIERQLLAPLEALLRDAQALLGVELDADRLEEAAGRGWSESAALPFPALNRTEPARRAIARPPAAGFSSAPLRGAVDSVQPGAPAVEQGEFPQRVVDRAEPGCLSPGALPTALQRTRFEQAFQFASSTPQSVSPQVGTDRSAGPASTRPYFNRPAPLAESFPVSGQHDAAEFPAVEWPIQPGEHPETRAARMLSGDGRQTPEAETARPAAASPHRLQPLGPQPDSHGTFAISLRPRQTPSPLGESPASSACNDAAAAPTEAHALRPDQHPQVPTAAMPSGDSHQPTVAAVTPPVASLADRSQPVNPAPDSPRSLAIPLRPRQALPPEPSFATAEAAKTPGPGNQLQAAARGLAVAVEPSLEQAYRLTQARLDTSATSASERIESPSLVRNTFNVTVALRADDASVSLDPSCGMFIGFIALDLFGTETNGDMVNISYDSDRTDNPFTAQVTFTTASGEEVSFISWQDRFYFELDEGIQRESQEGFNGVKVRYFESLPKIAKVTFIYHAEYVSRIIWLFWSFVALMIGVSSRRNKPVTIDLRQRKN